MNTHIICIMIAKITHTNKLYTCLHMHSWMQYTRECIWTHTYINTGVHETILLDLHAHMDTHRHVYTYIYIYMCTCIMYLCEYTYDYKRV